MITIIYLLNCVITGIEAPAPSSTSTSTTGGRKKSQMPGILQVINQHNSMAQSHRQSVRRNTAFHGMLPNKLIWIIVDITLRISCIFS